MDEHQSLYQKIASRGDRVAIDPPVATVVGRPGVTNAGEPPPALELSEGNEVKPRNLTIVLSAAGVLALGVLVTGVLAAQNKISIPLLMAANTTPKTVQTQAAEQPQIPPQPQSPPQPQAAQQPQAAVPPKPVFADNVGQSGPEQCRTIFPALGEAAAAQSEYKATTTWSQTKPDEHGIRSLVGMTIGGQGGDKMNGAGLVFAAPVGKGCEGVFVRVVPVTQDCPAVAASLPRESRTDKDFGGISVVTLPNGWQTMLVPSAGNGCVVMTTLQAVSQG